MRLITELNEDVKVLTEEANGKKNLFIEGIFLQAGIKNKNGRLYPPEIMEAEVNRYIKEAVEAHRAYGELGHPQTPQIGLDRVSHLIVSLKRNGNDWIGRAKITEGTPCGSIAKGLIDAGANLGVSSRALGSLTNKNGIMEVQNDFRLSTAGDIVANPSAPSAFVNGIYENAEWIWNNGLLEERRIVEAKREIDKAAATKNKAKLEEAFLRTWKSLLENNQ